MITIGFCSREHNQEHINHIIKSCGLVDLDIIEIVNNGSRSLTECYDEILNRSKFNINVFMHDDIILTTNNWGKRLIKHFNESDYGILGVAGSTELNDSGKWWDNAGLMVGIVEHTHNNKTHVSKYSNNFGDIIIETVVVDGLFFAVSKDKLSYRFNDKIKGFHFYDVDFSFGNHINGTKVGVIFNIKIRHKSIGITNSEWDNNREQFKKIWVNNLPHSIPGKIHYDEVNLKLKYEPKLSIIVLNKSNNELLFKCVESIQSKSKYKNYKIHIGDTGSSDSEITDIREFINQYDNVELHNIGKYNFGANNNTIVNNLIDKDTEILIFSNNDIELINDAITIMVKKYIDNRMNVGTIGCRLHYKNNMVQHSGIACFYLEHSKRIELSHIGLHSLYSYGGDEEVIGSTGAFLMIGKNLFNNIGQFNEEYIECFEDVELNLNTIIHNKKNYVMNSGVGYHYESVTRNLDKNKNKKISEDYELRLKPFISKNIGKLRKHIKLIR